MRIECRISNIKLNPTFESECQISKSLQHSNFNCRISNIKLNPTFTQAVNLNLTLRPDYNMAEIKQQQWGKQNKMNMHYEKTSCIILGTTHITQLSQELDINIDDNKIKNLTKQKLLGTCIYIDENLQWSDHIDYLCSTILSKISLLKQLSLYIPVEAQKLHYQG